MPAKLRFNSDKSLVEIETPAGESFGPMEIPEDHIIMLCDEDEPQNPAYVAVVGDYDGLDAFKLYQLVLVSTEVEEDVSLVEETEEEEEEVDE
ncbi:MAG: hypothetical protein WAN65_01970 [Candidatus Sulfotelmatobacter sp.]